MGRRIPDPHTRVALDENFCIRKEDYYGENGGIVFPNPNAPTALAMGLDDVEDIIRHNPDVIVIVDEAYVDFGAESALKLVEKYENLLVVQTFSKSRSLAGMRIGFAIGSPKLIKYLNDVKYSFNSYTLNQTSLACGVEAVKDQAYFNETRTRIMKTREHAKEVLERWDSPSRTPRQISCSSPTRITRRKNCFRRCARRISMSVTLTSRGSTIISA